MISYGDMTTNVENSRTNLRKIARHEESEFSNASILNSMERFVKTVNEMEETILVPSRLLDLSVGDSSDTTRETGSKKRGNAVGGGGLAAVGTGAGEKTIRDSLANTNLYRLYNIVNRMKLELLWSQKSSEDEGVCGNEEEREIAIVTDNGRRLKSSSSSSLPLSSSSSSSRIATTDGVATTMANVAATRLGHARCPSTASIQSVQSAASSTISSSSDTESDLGIENDSGLETEDNAAATAAAAAAAGGATAAETETEETDDGLANLAAENFRRHLRGLHRSIKCMTQAAEYLTLRYQADVGGTV